MCTELCIDKMLHEVSIECCKLIVSAYDTATTTDHSSVNQTEWWRWCCSSSGNRTKKCCRNALGVSLMNQIMANGSQALLSLSKWVCVCVCAICDSGTANVAVERRAEQRLCWCWIWFFFILYNLLNRQLQRRWYWHQKLIRLIQMECVDVGIWIFCKIISKDQRDSSWNFCFFLFWLLQ